MDSNLAITWEKSEQEDSLVIQHFEKPDSILKETENWRNRVKKEDALLNQNLKIDLESKESNLKKRKCEEKGIRKPSKFFRKCPDIEIRQNAPDINAGTKNAVMLLKNGSRFMQPIELNHRIYRVRDTCPFDSIAEILAEAANDNSEYLEHLENSNNFFCGFILEYIDSGAQKHVYGQRCLILKDFVDPQKPNMKPLVQNVGLYSFSVFCNLFDMWNFLSKDEPSMYRAKHCICGFVEKEECPILYVNHQIIAQEGYKEIEKALLINDEFTKEPCIRENCSLLSTVQTTFNAHVFIEADVRRSNDLKESMTCKVRNFPVYLNLHGEKFRLTGIVIHNGINHYIALCRKIDGTWQMHNDTANKITTFKKVIIIKTAYLKL